MTTAVADADVQSAGSVLPLEGEESAATRLKRSILELQAKKEALEKSVAEAMRLLESTSVGLNGMLVDAEGFPRSDVDHYSVRDARHTVACGMNDLKAMDDSLHEMLRQLHETSTAEATKQMEVDDTMREQRRRETELKQKRLRLEAEMKHLSPFLRVANVATGSPADFCGLQSDDCIVDIQGFRREDFLRDSMKGLGQLIGRTEGTVVSVWVLRPQPNTTNAKQTCVLEMPLVPQRWKGDGLVGCSFDPM